MARPREFDEGRALEAAMRAFWENGYDGTSTEELCGAIGLGRSSLYNTFLSKRDLFRRALRKYAEDREETLRSRLDAPAPIRAKVRALLEEAVHPAQDDPLGCLSVNSMVELAPHHPEVRSLLLRDYQARIELLEAALDAAVRSGELDRDATPRGLAEFILATVTALHVRRRAGAPPSELEAIANAALRVL